MDPNAQARPGLIIIVLVALAAISILGVAAVIGFSILRPVLFPREPVGVSVAAQVTDAPTPTSTATATVANTATITDVPTVTAVPPTATNTATPTNTPTITPTDTPGPPTDTPIPPTATKKPTRAPTLPPPTSAAGQCVAVVGDSVAHGDAVYEIPGVGFLQAQLLPLSAYIDQDLKARGTSSMTVLNRSSSAVGISTSNHPSYFSTGEYAQLLNDGCKYVAVIPWINDLSSGTDAGSAAGAHVAALSTLVQAILGKSPRSKILIVNYYAGAAAPFALSSFATGFTPGNVATFNQQISAACSGGALANPQVLCLDVNPVFSGMGFSYLIGPANHQDVSSMGIASPDQQNQVNFFFSNHPDGQLTGDGVHLSNAGKSALASFLVGQMP